MKNKYLEKNLPLADLEFFLEEDDEFYNSKTEVECEEKNSYRDLVNLNYVAVKKFKIKVHRCEHEIYNINTDSYEFSGFSYIITYLNSDNIIYECEESSFTDAITNYISSIDDEACLDDIDYLTCDVVAVV